MRPVEPFALYSNHLDVSPGLLWWIWWDRLERVADGPDRAQAVAFAEARDPGDVPDKAEFAALVASMAAHGWTGSGRIDVAIDECGRFVVTNGNHRASTAIALGIPTVPVNVVYRDVRWVALKNRLWEIGGQECALYQPIDHPEFAAWQTWRTDTEARADRIAQWLRSRFPIARGGLDYACHTGALCRRLVERGYAMHGVDADDRVLDVATRLDDVEGWTPTRPTYSAPDDLRPPRDFALCLSLLNHHATDGRADEGRDLFRALAAACPIVITDCPSPGDPVGGESEFVDPDAWIRWLASSGAPGRGEVLAERGAELQRTLIAWTR